MVEQQKVIDLIKSSFPNEDYETIKKLASEIIRDIIPIMLTKEKHVKI